MRVTDQQMFSALTWRINRNWQHLEKVQDQIASGQQINKPSDDPVSSSRTGVLDETISHLDNMDRSADQASGYLEAIEGTLGQVSDLLIRARELAVQGASDENDAQARADIALEIRSMFDQLVSLGNLDVGGRHVFAGFLSDQPAFASDGSYNGDSNELEIRVSPGLQVKATVAGDRVFGGAGGGVDIFSVLDGLATALETDDTVNIQNSLDGLDAGLSQINSERALAGSRLDSVQLAKGWNDRLRTGAKAQRADIRDLDLSKASIELAMAQQALQATMASTPRMMAQSLLNYL